MFTRLAEVMAASGWSTALFDQCGSGYSVGSYSEVRLRSIVNDVMTVYEELARRFDSVAIIGQSLGSTVSIDLVLAELLDPVVVVALNPVDDFDSWMPSRFGWDPSGKEQVLVALPKGILVSRNFFEELLEWQWTYPSEDSKRPRLHIILSQMDELPTAATVQRLECLIPGANVHTISGANHSFIGQPQEERAMFATVQAIFQGVT